MSGLAYPHLWLCISSLDQGHLSAAFRRDSQAIRRYILGIRSFWSGRHVDKYMTVQKLKVVRKKASFHGLIVGHHIFNRSLCFFD